MARGPIPDKPRDRPTVPEVLPIAKTYYDRHSLGGSLHVVLEDGNLGDGHIEWCREYARTEGDAEGAALASMLLGMTGTQRRCVYRSL